MTDKTSKSISPSTPSFTLGKQENSFPDSLSGANARGEAAGCPTGLADPEQAQAPQLPGGGGAPGTGGVDLSVPGSPGEGITEEEIERVEKNNG